MKTILLLLLTVTLAHAQAGLYGNKVKGPITLANGDQIDVGDTIRFGYGTLPGGSFKFIQTPANMILGIPEEPLNYSWRNRFAVINAFRLMETKRYGNKFYVVASAGRNAMIEIEPAIQSGEVSGVNDRVFIVGSNEQKTAPASVADELLKLKQLLDAGAITQSEYDGQKKKLLGN